MENSQKDSGRKLGLLVVMRRSETAPCSVCTNKCGDTGEDFALLWISREVSWDVVWGKIRAAPPAIRIRASANQGRRDASRTPH